MTKFYSLIFKWNGFIALCLLLLVTSANAQTDYSIGTGLIGNTTTTYPCPLQDRYEGSRMQYLYLASELTAAGMAPGNINAIKYNIVSLGTAGIIEQHTMRIGGTATTSLTATNWETVTNTVFGPVNYQPVAGINTFTFSTPYFWNGTDNIVIEICGGDPATTTGTFWTTNPVIPWTTGLSFNGSHSYRADNLDNLCGTATTTNTGTQTTRPNITLNWTSATACSGVPVAGTATANPSTVCLGISFNLSLSGTTVASGLTYQWQSSPDNVTFTDIPGATTFSFNTTQLVTTYYRAVVTCTGTPGGSATTTSVQVFSPAAVSGTFTINSALPTGGTNFQTFNAAYDYIKCGINGPVIFNVDAASGPYNEQLIMIPVPGASAINTVTFNGNGRILQNTSTLNGERAVIKLNGADHIKFDNLVINANGTLTTQYGFGVQLINSADSNAVTNCTININTTSISTNFAGIVMNASHTSAVTTGSTLSDGNLFEGNTITGGYYGITCVGSTSEANANNIFRRNTITDFYFYGMYIVGNFNTKIDSNTVSRPTRATVTIFNGIYLNSLNINVQVTRNTITNPFGGIPTSTALFNGIFISASDALSGVDNKIINNKIYNITGAGEANGINATGSDNLLIQHNTILMDGIGGTAVTRGFYQTTAAAGVTFENNIVAITRAGTGAKYAIYFNTIASDIISNKNDFFLNSPTGNDFTGFYTTARATLSDWQTASGDDANSVASNPFFENAAIGDLKPTNAGIDNLGNPLGVLIDITGAPRSLTTPDIGAYEFVPGNCIAPPIAGAATVSSSPVCVNTPVQLMLTGYSYGLGQTYQWQFSANIAGPYTNLGAPLNNADSTIISTTTLYYRAALTCGGNTSFSAPVLLTVTPALPAGVYTINQTLPTGGTNYTNFNAAKTAMNCGITGPVVFNVVSGTGPYNEQLILGSIAGTSATNTITFNGNGNKIAFSSSDNLDRAVIKLRDADHITFDSLEIDATGTGTYGFGVHLINNADSNTFNNCIVLNNITSTSVNFAGMVISASESAATTTGNTLCDGNTFSNNTIIGGYYGVTVVGSTTAFINNNRVTGNKIIDFYSYGIYLAGNNNPLVELNDISRPTRSVVGAHYGVYATGVQQGLTVSKNRIHGSFAGNTASTAIFYGIYFTGVDAATTSPSVVSNNLVYDIKSAATQYGIYNASSDYTKYYHNTIALDDAGNLTTSISYGFYQTTLSDSIDFKNNIVYISRAGTGNKFGLYFSTSTSTITSNYNNILVLGTSAFTGYNGTNRATLANWQAATLQDANSIAMQPIFSNPVTGNYSPLNPAMDNLGSPVGISTDILNVGRSAITPDMGAYEFTIPPCTTPPVAGAATAIPNSGICMGTRVDLSLSGYNLGAGQTYQWEYAAAIGGPYAPLGGSRLFPDTTIFATTTLYYRVAVTCSGNTAFSTPVLVTLNPAFLAGTYTINSTIPASAVNFTSFATAVAALECGITGPVYFDVAPNTYTEQIRMHGIAGTSPTVRVTFRSANGDPASVILTNNATVAANNYTLKLDSASYITYQNMTINATNATNGRVIEIANTASFDSIVNCRINAPVSTGTANSIAGIYADLLRGSGNVIKNNIITNGSSGIYFEGTSTAALTYDNVIDSNTINNSFYYGIYIGMNGRIKTTRNIVNVTMPRNATSYGIYSTSSDSAYQYVANKINISGITSTTTYGMYFTGCDGGQNTRGRIAGNTIMALTGNTGILYGLYQTASTNNNTINNVISISTTGATSYASYYTGGGGVRFQNNSLVSTATSATNNVVAYFAQISGANPAVNIQNNIFSHLGGGRAMYVTNLSFINSDYNTFYTTGTNLIQLNAGNLYPTLQQWRDTSYGDFSSIAIEPALLSSSDLRPDLADPDVWAIHGRGTQIMGNDYDFNNASRPTTLTTGVPDMGAFEFLPTAQPTVLFATPATPAPGITQTFMYGTDTVAKITYDAAAPVPASISLRRYSGVIPPGLTAGQMSMYYYTDVDVPAQGAYNYKLQHFYVDSWQGFIPSQPAIKLGQTNASNAWIVRPNSRVNENYEVFSDSGLIYMDKFTGLSDGSIITTPPTTPSLPPADSSNRGTKFWVGYGHHQNFTASNSQDMVLYFSAEQAANVTVKINGTLYSKTYSVPANSVITSALVPKYGQYDARLLIDGKSSRGISIESDVPIVAYAHIYASTTSEAAMLLPVGTYGYEYTALTTKQNYADDTYSWVYVIADNDSTKITITPSNPTLGGSPAGIPFDVYLNKGEIYQVLGALIDEDDGYDLTGTTIKSIPNSNGRCLPVAVFSGSSRTNIGCGTSDPSGSGDNIIEQNFPYTAWGRKYLVAPTSNSTSASSFHTNIYRVAVKNPATVVTRNGIPLTGLINNFFYQFESNTADVIEGSEPFIVAQIMSSSGFCPNTSGGGDPAMIYVSPVEQGIKRVGLYRNTESAITVQYLTLVIPTAGLTSLTIDGSSTFNHTYAHTNPGYTVVVKRWSPAANAQVIVQSDSAFTAITYGLGSVESYGYNAGTLVKNLSILPAFFNTLSSTGNSSYTCAKAPFKISASIPLKPTSILWQVSQVPGLNPNSDILQNNPVPVDSILVNGRWFYRYVLNIDYRFALPGIYIIPIRISHPTIEGCSNTQEATLTINVLPAPQADFTGDFAVCLGETISFNGLGSTSNNVPITSYNWTFGDATSATGQNQVKTYAAAGTYNVNFNIIAQDGCIGDTTKQVIVSPIPVVTVVSDSLEVCGATPAAFTVANPVAGATYGWYSQPTGGTAVFTGITFTIPSVSGTVVYYVQPTSAAGCVGLRKRVIATVLPDLATPVAVVDSIGVDRIKFRWNAVPGALTYEISTNGGNTWSTPSSGATGLTHTVTGLLPLTNATLTVRAKGSLSCLVATSLPVTGKTLPDQIYIPNAFSPNGDGLNDVLLVYGYTVKSLKFNIFNQWGQKIFESSSQSTGWDGRFKGKAQPSGVYMYVCQLILNDGSTLLKKGSINLVR